MASGPETPSPATPDTPSPTPEAPSTPMAPEAPPSASDSANEPILHTNQPRPTDSAYPYNPVTQPSSTNSPDSEFRKEAIATWERIKNAQNGWLMAEKNPVEEVSLIKTPFYIIRDLVRGSIGNTLRRSREVLDPLKGFFISAKNLITSPFKAKETPIFHPIKYLSNIPRIVTATAKSIKNLLKSPIAATDEAYQDIIQNPIERIDYKVKKIPPKKITGLIAKFNNGITKALGWPLRTINRISKGVTDWIDDIDGYFGAAIQGA